MKLLNHFLEDLFSEGMTVFAILRRLFPGGTLEQFERQGALARRFRGPIGKFQFTVESVPTASDDLIFGGDERLATRLSVDFPPVDNFEFQIRRRAVSLLRGDRMQDFLGDLAVRFSDEELVALMRQRAFLMSLYGLWSQCRGSIDCDGRRFTATVCEEVAGRQRTLGFIGSALRAFQLVAQIAQVRSLNWRAPEVNFDWWRPLDLPAAPPTPEPEDLFSPELARYLEREFSLEEPDRREAICGQRFDPKAFVLCSRCFGALDETLVTCPRCGAGHHWRCAEAPCGECGAALRRPDTPPRTEGEPPGEGDPHHCALHAPSGGEEAAATDHAAGDDPSPSAERPRRSPLPPPRRP